MEQRASTRMNRLLLLSFTVCSLFTACASVALKCDPLPEAPIPSGFTKMELIEITTGTTTIVECLGEIRGQFDVNGPSLKMGSQLFCDAATKKLYLNDPGYTRMPISLVCASAADWGTQCAADIESDAGKAYIFSDKPANVLCPPNSDVQLSDGTKFKSFACGEWTPNAAGDYVSTYTIELLDGSKITRDYVFGSGNMFTAKCITQPTTTTTTSTVATTTTVKADAPAAASNLWNVNYYYNYGVAVHAFCADSVCINAIQKNGIGYDMNSGWGLMGKAVSESQITAVRASCPTGSQNLRNLGFTKSGNKYLHNLNGSGLKQGWVAISSGACGATVPIKRWKSRVADDMMYGVDLEWNTWYQGMVQEGGQVHFYLWN